MTGWFILFCRCSTESPTTDKKSVKRREDLVWYFFTGTACLFFIFAAHFFITDSVYSQVVILSTGVNSDTGVRVGGGGEFRHGWGHFKTDRSRLAKYPGQFLLCGTACRGNNLLCWQQRKLTRILLQVGDDRF